MTKKFEYTSSEVLDGIVVFKLYGDLTELADKSFKKEFAKQIEESKYNFVFDFSEVNYVNSSGLGMLATMLKTVRKHKGEIKLCSVNPSIKNILDISKLTRVFEVYDDYELALEKLRLSLGKNVY